MHLYIYPTILPDIRLIKQIILLLHQPEKVLHLNQVEHLNLIVFPELRLL